MDLQNVTNTSKAVICRKGKTDTVLCNRTFVKTKLNPELPEITITKTPILVFSTDLLHQMQNIQMNSPYQFAV